MGGAFPQEAHERFTDVHGFHLKAVHLLPVGDQLRLAEKGGDKMQATDNQPLFHDQAGSEDAVQPAAGRVEMDRLGDDFFPSPGGAEDKRIDGAAGDGQGKLNDLPHGLALAHDLLGLVVFLNGPHQMRVALGEEPVRFLQLGVAGFQIRNEL